jgi:hypothetical protein
MVTSVRLSSLVSPALALEWSHSFAAAIFCFDGIRISPLLLPLLSKLLVVF